MQLICLNAWGGRAFDALAAFVSEHADATDVFCFQEVFSAGQPAATDDARRYSLLRELADLLPDFSSFFTPIERRPGTPTDPESWLESGLATLVRDRFAVREHGHVPLIAHTQASAGPGWETVGFRPLQFSRLALGARELLIATVHGTAEPSDKLDSPERLEQSARMLDFLLAQSGDAILCGDFNLLPETASISTITRHFRDLVREYGIATTRSRLNPYVGTPREQKHADYTFVSAGIDVRGFVVPDVAVSDHLPLILSFE